MQTQIYFDLIPSENRQKVLSDPCLFYNIFLSLSKFISVQGNCLSLWYANISVHFTICYDIHLNRYFLLDKDFDLCVLSLLNEEGH